MAKVGLKGLAKIFLTQSTKITVKIACEFLNLIPSIGTLFTVIIGSAIDFPSLYRSYIEGKKEFIRISDNSDSNIRRIVQNYNDAINFFGRRANIRINTDYYNIPNINNMPIFGVDFEEYLLNEENDNV